MKKLRVGIIGIGKIGLAQIKAIKSIENSGYAELAAISSRDPGKAQATCRQYGIPAYYSDYRIMFENAALDVVHNCTPNMVHYEINKKAILVGCHILSEKPLTVDCPVSRACRARRRKGSAECGQFCLSALFGHPAYKEND